MSASSAGGARRPGRGRRRFLASGVRVLAAGLLGLCSAGLAPAAPPAGAAEGMGDAGGRPLVVAVREAPPFAMRDATGSWEGLSVDLWQEVADRIPVAFEWRELDLTQTLDALESGEIDVAITALTVTAEREKRFDFAYPYLSSGLALAVDAARRSGWLQTLRAFFSLEFFTAVGALAVILLAAAFGVWVFERRANPDQFGGSAARGLGESFWWSAVTMTTVGYGDRAPVTPGGRAVALVWMFTSVIVIASFTASIAASVTVTRLGSDLLDEDELATARLAVLSGSRAESYARQSGLRARPYDTLDEAVEAVEAGRVEAVLHDAPILRHVARSRSEGTLQVVSGVLVRDDYAFAVPRASKDRERINVTLLGVLREPGWKMIRDRHLGLEEK